MAEPKVETLAETDVYEVLKIRGEEGETTYHLELGNVTLHFFPEEWEEFTDLMTQVIR
ncbi:MAG: hypothetical protein ACLFU8_12530 [Anaerolineales bacterium]